MVEKMHYFLVPLLNLHSNKSCRIMVIRVASFCKKMTSVEKRKPFPQVCCEFLIPVKKTVPTKNLEHFQTCKGENDMGARIFCHFRKHLVRKVDPSNG